MIYILIALLTALYTVNATKILREVIKLFICHPLQYEGYDGGSPTLANNLCHIDGREITLEEQNGIHQSTLHFSDHDAINSESQGIQQMAILSRMPMYNMDLLF